MKYLELMKGELLRVSYKIQLSVDEQLTLPASVIESVGAGDWIITIEQVPSPSMFDNLRNHNGFLNSYAACDECLYDDYPTR